LKVIEKDKAETADELGELEGQAAVSVAQFAPCFGDWIDGDVGSAARRLVSSCIVDSTRFSVTEGGIATDLGAMESIANTPSFLFLLGRTGTRFITGRWAVAGVLDKCTVHPGSRIVDHAIWAEQSHLPSLWGDETSITEQGDSTSEQIIQILDGDVSRARVVHLHGYRVLVGVGVAAKGGQKVTHTTFCWKVAVEEAKALGIIRVARFPQVA
jgi:hypothetical protein